MSPPFLSPQARGRGHPFPGVAEPQDCWHNGPVHGIARDVALGLGAAVFFAFFLALAWAGFAIRAADPLPPRREARHRKRPGYPPGSSQSPASRSQLAPADGRTSEPSPG